MTEVGGAELAQRIRSANGTGIVLIVLTGSVEASDQDEAERSGVDYLLHKSRGATIARVTLGCTRAPAHKTRNPPEACTGGGLLVIRWQRRRRWRADKSVSVTLPPSVS
jgi:DNA-binding response OmpR family regulator